MAQSEYINHLATVTHLAACVLNQFLVYQHDTPDKYLFNKIVRAYSHGCMRVANPDKYAETLLSISQPEVGFTVQRLHSLYGRGERNMKLKTPNFRLPHLSNRVHRWFGTDADPSGHLRLRQDNSWLAKPRHSKC